MIATKREDVTVGSTVRIIGTLDGVMIVDAVHADGVVAHESCALSNTTALCCCYPWSRVIFDAPKAEAGKVYRHGIRRWVGLADGRVERLAWNAGASEYMPFDPATMIPEGEQ